MHFPLTRPALGAVLATVGFLALGLPASAQITNGGFESGFSSWNTTGSALIVTSSFGDAPTQGTNQALLTNDPTPGDYGVGSVSSSILESNLGIAHGALSTLGNGTAVNGSGVGQAFTISAPERLLLKFDADFLTTEDPTNPPFNPDFAFVSLSNATAPALNFLSRIAQVSDATIAETLPPGPPSPTAGDFLTETGYRSVQIQQTLLPGTYTLGFGVVNANTGDIASSLLLDNVQTQLTPVPEVGTSATFALLLGMGGMVFVRRSRKSGANS